MASVAASLAEANSHQSTHSIQTPPATDGSSHGKRDDDAASSSDLSDLDEQFEEQPTQIIEPDRIEDGVPVFTPVCPPFLQALLT